MNRRDALRASAAFAFGAASVAGCQKVAQVVGADDPLPIYSGPAVTIHRDRRSAPVHRRASVRWAVETSKKLIALTFDDGPMPHWTPDVLDILDAHKIPATFFMVGKNAAAHRGLIHGRLDRHEVGNHTWAHRDLAKADYDEARRAIDRGHRALSAVTGREPVLLRPPFGHLAGSTLLAAADLGYTIALWNLQMLESDYVQHPAGLVDYIVDSTTPGTMLLAHDTGKADRLVAIRGLPKMIERLKGRGFEFVTASDLLAEAQSGDLPNHGSRR